MINNDQRLAYCRICLNRKFNLKEGIVCGLTDQKPDFENTCPNFKTDQKRKEELATGSMQVRLESIRAGRVPRLINYVLDILCIRAIGTGIAVLYFLVYFSAFPQRNTAQSEIIWIILALELTVYIAYYWVLESFTGRTLGKFITGTAVLNDKGKTPSNKELLVRTLTRLIPFEQFTFLSTERKGLHDTLSGTYVVKIQKSQSK